MILADLHTHSNASDGEHSPEELIQLAKARGVKVLALTDHDTTAGLERAANAAMAAQIKFIPGVELSVDVPDIEMHILGYYIKQQADDLQAILAKFRKGRIERVEKMVQKLNELDVPISLQRVKDIAGNASISRVHIAQAMIEAAHVRSIEQAFENFIGYGRPAYFSRFKLPPEDAIQLILKAGGIPVLAHPQKVFHYLPLLVDAGLIGLEVWYAAYDSQLQIQLEELARRYDLIPTGGSDFHGIHRTGYRSILGQGAIPPAALARLEQKKIDSARMRFV